MYRFLSWPSDLIMLSLTEIRKIEGRYSGGGGEIEGYDLQMLKNSQVRRWTAPGVQEKDLYGGYKFWSH